jgi:hypothetical protein
VTPRPRVVPPELVERLRRLDPEELRQAARAADLLLGSMGYSMAVRLEAALGGAHKARLVIGRPYFTSKELKASRAWVKEHYGRK